MISELGRESIGEFERSLDCGLFQNAEINNEASRYIEENFDKLVKWAHYKTKEPVDMFDKALNLVEDVYISIKEAENNGNGYSLEKSNDGDIVTVEQFVYGRLEGYSKNIRYRFMPGVSEYRRVGTDKNSDNIFSVTCASSNGDEEAENLSAIQLAFNNAPAYDDIIESDIDVSLRQNIDFCLEFRSRTSIDILRIFNNIEHLAKYELDPQMFSSLRKLMNYHEDLKEAFIQVMEASRNNRQHFMSVLAKVNIDYGYNM